MPTSFAAERLLHPTCSQIERRLPGGWPTRRQRQRSQRILLDAAGASQSHGAAPPDDCGLGVGNSRFAGSPPLGRPSDPRRQGVNELCLGCRTLSLFLVVILVFSREDRCTCTHFHPLRSPLSDCLPVSAGAPLSLARGLRKGWIIYCRVVLSLSPSFLCTSSGWEWCPCVT